MVVLSSLGTAGLVTLLDKGEPVYVCESKGLVSDCINGVKACTGSVCTRCYYDPENTRKYEYCSEGWEKVVKELEPIPTTPSDVPSQSSARKYLCDQTKCVPID